MGTVFIAVDKCDQENGCLKVHKLTLHACYAYSVNSLIRMSIGAEGVPSSGQDRP